MFYNSLILKDILRVTPFFSIVIPAYNRADFIRETISSVINQTFRDWECIVVDDGSTDNTKEVIKELMIEDARIHYVFQNNAERSAARNNGIKHASGKYICFLDSDDLFKENHLQVISDEIIKTNNENVIYFTNSEVLRKGEIEVVQSGKLFDDIFMFLTNNPIIPARVAIPKTALKQNQFDEDIVVVEDLCLWFKLAIENQFVQIEESTVLYHLHDNNSINLKNNAALKRLKGLRLFKKKHPKVYIAIGKDNFDKLLGETYFSFMKYHIINNKKWKAIKYLIISIFYQKTTLLKHKVYVFFKLILNKSIPEYHQNIIN